jgi:SRSO17 transposase
LPEEWFGPDFAQRRKELGIPEERTFETKIALGLKMVKRAKAHGLPFELLACDALYGRDHHFRADLHKTPYGRTLGTSEVSSGTSSLCG